MATTKLTRISQAGHAGHERRGFPEVVSEIMKTREVSAEEFFETAEQKRGEEEGPPRRCRSCIPRDGIASLVVKIIGDSPNFSVHKWSQKAINQMKAKHARQATAGREVRESASGIPGFDLLPSIFHREETSVRFSSRRF